MRNVINGPSNISDHQHNPKIDGVQKRVTRVFIEVKGNGILK